MYAHKLKEKFSERFFCSESSLSALALAIETW